MEIYNVLMNIEALIVYGSKEAIIQNLKDAGIQEFLIETILQDLQDDKIKEVLAILEQQRSQLLSIVHKKERQIDCLDYFVYQVKRSV